jgi:hypothetical protein
MKMRIGLRNWVLATMAAATIGGCSTKDKLDKALDNASDTAKEAKALLQNLNGLMAKLDGVPKLAVTNVSPATSAGVKIPGGKSLALDPAAARDGQQGTLEHDLDEDGDGESVSFLIEETGTTFFWWSDDGICYLAWDSGSESSVLFSECGADDGVYVCDYDESVDDFECAACNHSGQCAECTEQSCEIPAAIATCDPAEAQSIVSMLVQCDGASESTAHELCQDPGADWVSSCSQLISSGDCAALDSCFAQ